MSGGGVGGTLGSVLGAALAPETGGLSLAIPAILGAGGAYLGGTLSGDKNPLMDAVMGGIGGGLGGASGLGSSLGIGDVGGIGDTVQGALPSWLGGVAGAGESMSPALATADAAAAPGAVGAADSGINSATDNLVNQFSAQQAANTGNGGSGILDYLGKQNPLNLALAGGTALSGIQSLMPHKQVNVGQNAADVMATNPNFNNPNLPKYSMQNTASPYTGNWYTYGQSPQTPMYNAMPRPVKHGGLIGYSHGGRVGGYAAGGMPMMPQGAAMPSQGMPQRPAMPQQPVNPLMLQAAHHVGVAIGRHIKNTRHTPLGRVQGAGGGQDDAIPAKLSDGEYIIPADVTAHLGDGSSNAGGKKLDQMVHKVRVQKAVKGFPPKARNPLSYVKA